MHWEFRVKHDMRWLHRWGLTYYGCCEPLHNKIEVLRHIPNLRKVSCSAWCDLEKMVAELGQNCILSVKPSPAILAEDDWSPEQARAVLRRTVEITEGAAHVEIIMKDISTVRYKPQRLWCVYQAHQYSRTRFFLDEFAASFAQADKAIIPEIYFVRDSEASRKQVSGEILAGRIRERGTDTEYIGCFDEICDYLEQHARAGDVVVTMGAGDVWKVADEYIQRLRSDY